MGIAWFDDDPPPMEVAALRTGGLPLLTDDEPWPSCPQCEVPMLFRAQVPLALTSLVACDDERLILLFECHHTTERGPCDVGSVVVTRGAVAPKPAPSATTFDVAITALGPRPFGVLEIASQIGDVELRAGSAVPMPLVVLRAAPSFLAEEAVRAIFGSGGDAVLRASPPMLLRDHHGGLLVPFDDGRRGLGATTLPPLGQLTEAVGQRTIRGLLGGATPGYRDHAFACTCGRPTRTIVRLLAQQAPLSDVRLGPAVAQLCLQCSKGALYRSAG